MKKQSVKWRSIENIVINDDARYSVFDYTESSGPLRIYQRMVGCCFSRLLGHLLAILQHAIKYLLRNPKDIKKSLTNQNLDLTQVFRVEYD